MSYPQSSRQPIRKPWTLDTFLRERSLALANSVDLSTRRTYSSALNSWIAFTNLHDFPFEPTIDTLSFFIVFMSHHISPRSVKSYLSGIVQQLEPDFPSIKEIRVSPLIAKVMKGCLKTKSKPIRRKDPLSVEDLRLIGERFTNSRNHDDLLFSAILFTGFHGLLRLGEMTFPDDPKIRDWRKVSRRSSLFQNRLEYSFTLFSHKGDRFFEGNKVLIRAFDNSSVDPIPAFTCYLSSRDHLFPASSPLWLTSAGTVPTRSFFMSRFRRFFPNSFAGASMRAGGATHLAMLGVSSKIIRAMGRWSSKAWEIYIRLHPTLLQALLRHRRKT